MARLPGALILAARLRLAWVHLAVLPFRWVGAEKSKETRETVGFYLEHSGAAGGRPAAWPLLLYLDTFSRLRPATVAPGAGSKRRALAREPHIASAFIKKTNAYNGTTDHIAIPSLVVCPNSDTL